MVFITWELLADGRPIQWDLYPVNVNLWNSFDLTLYVMDGEQMVTEDRGTQRDTGGYRSSWNSQSVAGFEGEDNNYKHKYS